MFLQHHRVFDLNQFGLMHPVL
jgi:hypothetical protein